MQVPFFFFKSSFTKEYAISFFSNLPYALPQGQGSQMGLAAAACVAGFG